MGFRDAVIGSGRQGTAAAYDLAMLGDAEYVLMADMSLAQAEKAAARVNQLAGREVARAAQVDVQDEDAVVALLTGSAIQVFVSGVPYFFNMGLTRAALRARASMCDFGGNTDQIRRQLAYDAEAKAAGITLIPDCGQVPGLGTSLCAYALDLRGQAAYLAEQDASLARPLRPVEGLQRRRVDRPGAGRGRWTASDSASPAARSAGAEDSRAARRARPGDRAYHRARHQGWTGNRGGR